MRIAATCRLALWTVACLAMAGCQIQRPLNLDKTLELEPGEFKILEIDAPVSDQTIAVTTASPCSPLDVYLLLDEDWAKAQKGMEGGAPPENALASQKKTEKGSVEGKVPAKKKFVVVVSNPINNKKTTAKLTVKSK